MRMGIPGTVRASFALYNTKAEVDVLVAAVDRVRRCFKKIQSYINKRQSRARVMFLNCTLVIKHLILVCTAIALFLVTL